MSLFADRTGAALIVIDVQNGVAEGAYNLEQVLTNINAAVAKARAAGIPVIWVQHSEDEMPIDSEGWQIVPQLDPHADEPHVRKTYSSSFEATNLDEVLKEHSIGHVFICGMQTNNCVRHTTHAALERGYDVTLIKDAHSTTGYTWGGHTIDAENLVNEQNDNFGNYQLPGRKAVGVATEQLTF